jgi:dihydrofolate synthase / folylpolyglutamate synthase
MNYQQTVEFLFTHLPMFQRIGAAAYKKDLTNTIALLEVLGNPQDSFTAVHVAGTNGKGSVSNMLAAVCAEAGYVTGLYTSPHLVDFRERIRVNGQLCEEQFVIDFVRKIQPHIETIQPSFFEITVAMAFDYFRYKEVQIAIVEVGLGGRLDSTNVITPVVSVITNISFDHMQMLGKTLALIAGEKAGIIKPNVPVVIGEIHPETLPVFESKALETNSTLYPAPENISVELLEQNFSNIELNISYLNQLTYPNLMLDLSGIYQLQNVGTVIQTLEVMRLQGIEIPEESVYDGLKQVQRLTGFAGRWQVLQKSPLVVADCAHNTGGLKLLFEQVQQMEFEQLHIVTGAVNDKDLDAGLNLFPLNALYYFCKPDIPRGLDAQQLLQMAADKGLQGEHYASVQQALATALNNASQNDLILICGSIFVVAEALPAFTALTNKTESI